MQNILFTTLLFAMVITIILIPIMRGVAVRRNTIMDIPNARKVHEAPMPKIGGISMALGALTPVLLSVSGGPFVRAVLLGGAIVAVSGILDDIKDLGFKAKFAAQLVASLVVIFMGGLRISSLGTLLPGGFALPETVSVLLTILVIVGVTNAVNLADGLDGLAGGICLLTFISIACLGYQADKIHITLVAMAMSGAIFGFLRFNTFPATIFMGDAGSQLLGFLAITLALDVTQGESTLSPLLPLFLIGIPVFDTLTVMSERLVSGRSPFVADQNHFHHKLIKLGLRHRETVMIIYALHALLIVVGLAFRFRSDWLLLFCYLAFSGLLLAFMKIVAQREWRVSRQSYGEESSQQEPGRIVDRDLIIRMVFPGICVGIPALLFFSSFVATDLPRYVGTLALGSVAMVVLTWMARPQWLDRALRFALIGLAPFVIYFSDVDAAQWLNPKMAAFYNFWFAAMAIFSILTISCTRRRNGYQPSPLDILVLFVALVLPNLPGQQARNLNLDLIGAKIIILFFIYEIILGELRGKVAWVGLGTVATLLVMAVRGLT